MTKPSRNGVARRASSRVVGVDELTPWERHRGCWYKRDDLFAPFDDIPLSGGKVRQAMLLLERQKAAIERDYGGFVLTATGVHSPQGLIIARVAVSLGLRCVLFIGATSVGGALLKHAMLRRAIEVGAEIDASARVAYEPALAAAIERWRDAHDGVGYVVRFGINLEDDPAAILGSTAEQVRNTPALAAHRRAESASLPVADAGTYRPDVLFAGSGHRNGDCRGRDQSVSARGHACRHIVEGIAYSTLVPRAVVDGFDLDPIYEAKAHDWMREHEHDDGSVAFWVVGDSTAVRSVTTAAIGDAAQQCCVERAQLVAYAQPIATLSRA